MDSSKICSKCAIKKDLSDFHKEKKTKDGHRSDCKVCKCAMTSSWQKENPEYAANWRKENSEYSAKYQRQRRAVDESFKISTNLSSLLTSCLKKKRKQSILEKHIDCSLEVLYDWIAYQFTDKMNWSNYGKYWCVDHCIPRSHFNHCAEVELALAWNWRNLQPLTMAENYSKGKSVDYELYYQQVSLASEFLSEFDQDVDSEFCVEFSAFD